MTATGRGGPLATEQSPLKFGDYHLVERIATGGMAEVWKATAFGLAGFEKTLVIKKILESLAKDEEFVRLFIDEARIAVLLQHVNIVQVFDLGRAEDTLYMAMEYVSGLDLARLLSRGRHRGPFPLPLALFIISEVLKALRFAHERTGEEGEPLDIVHCDISPQNILVSHAGEVKITDFGISRAAFQAASLHDVVRGKYAYMSPEQIENDPLDARSDLFSLGIVLWEMMTGRRLFKARSKEETLRRVKRAEVPSPRSYRPEVSEELQSLVLRALARRPEQRFRSAADMLEALSVLMVREGHRANNHELSAFVKEIADARPDQAAPAARSAQETVVVLAAEASPLSARTGSSDPKTAPPPQRGSVPSDSVPTPDGTIDDGSSELVEAWCDSLVKAGAQIWERGRTSALAVWVVEEDLGATLRGAIDTVQALSKATGHAGFRMAAGVAPGKTRIFVDSRRPGAGWELAGPYYLARWMMNLSAHRGRILLTEVGAKHLDADGADHLGRISIRDDRFINLYELG